MIGKWHMGEGPQHQPRDFDYWDVVPGQGDYYDPMFINAAGRCREKGYATDVITDKTINFIENRDKDRPFFIMCHHKAPHRPWQCDPKHKHLYRENIKLPETFDDDYKNRAKAAAAAKMRIASDMTYEDLGLVQPEGGDEVGDLNIPFLPFLKTRKIPNPEDVTKMVLIDNDTGENFRFKTREELRYAYLETRMAC